MADDFTVSLGTEDGAPVRMTEDASGKKHQHVILEFDDGTTTPVALVGGSGVISGGTLRVTVATDDSVATDLTTIAGDTPGMLTAVQLIDDAIFADDAIFTLASSKVMVAGAIHDATLSALAAADGDAVPLRVDANGALHVTVTESAAVSTDDTDTHATGTTKGVNIMAAATPTDTSVAANDIGMLAMSLDRRLHTDSDTRPDNTISTNNSTTATLGISGVYTGTGDDVSGYTAVTVTLDSSHDSATDGMTFQFSTDNTNWDDVYTFTYTAADGARRFQFPVTAQYFRIVYTNGGTGQTHFRVQTILHANSTQTSVHRLADNVSADRSASVVKSAILAQTSGSGDFVPVAANASGKLQVAAEVAGAETPADADATPTDAVPVQAFNSLYNGTTWDLMREGGVAGSVLVAGGVAAGSPYLGAAPVPAGVLLKNNIEGTTQGDDGDIGVILADLNGCLVTRPHTTLEEIITERVSTSTDAAVAFTNFPAGGAGVHNYITTITVYNSSATDGYVDIRDGVAGSPIFTVPAPATGGSVINLPVPLKGAVNTALAYDVSAALTTVYISVVGFQAQG